MTKTYAIVGDPIDHSLSPLIHNAAFRSLNLDSTYIAYRIQKNELEVGIEALKKIKIAGFNVTIPHKTEMMKFLDEIDDVCNMCGAVNTVVNNDGVLKGYNTDIDGFLDPIKRKNLTIKDSEVLILGAGGAARAIIAGMVKEKAGKITITNRTLKNATELVQFTKNIGGDATVIPLEEIDQFVSGHKFIINSTSVGLRNEPSLISTDQMDKNSIVYDIVYTPMNTDLINNAKKNGATIIYGYEMLLSQASRAFEIWHGVKAPYDDMKKAIFGGV
jgi:shikimate dehydrogenase